MVDDKSAMNVDNQSEDGELKRTPEKLVLGMFYSFGG